MARGRPRRGCRPRAREPARAGAHERTKRGAAAARCGNLAAGSTYAGGLGQDRGAAEPTSGSTAARYYPLKTRIAVAAGRPVDAVRAEIAAERYAAGAAERAGLRAQLLEALRGARDRGVSLESQPTQDPVVRG